MKKIVIFIMLFLMQTSVVMAHGGGTDSCGCHTNKKTGDYHCHTRKPCRIKKYPQMLEYDENKNLLEFSYEIHKINTAIINEKDVLKTAKVECVNFGYDTAKKIDKIREGCPGGGSFCSKVEVVVQYKCLND